MERITHPIWTVRNVRTLFLGESISYFGDAFFNLAIVWAVYSATGSLFATSLIQVVWHVTDAVASPIAGVLADRHDRARIMVVTTFASAITLLLLTASIWMRGVQIVDALVAIVLVNFWTTFYRPARASALPDMVDAASYLSVQGAFSSTRLVADVVGTGLGGVMIATYGVVPAMGLNALSFALMGLDRKSVV